MSRPTPLTPANDNRPPSTHFRTLLPERADLERFLGSLRGHLDDAATQRCISLLRQRLEA